MVEALGALTFEDGWRVSQPKGMMSSREKAQKKSIVHCVQRQPLREVTKAPVTGLEDMGISIG